mmetsp:Transcript_19314/g.53631  ORF Transcript_19314/g.53631 Transcript_19314/m.53631 type:complete len:553 (-) Transcript_19314:130-1788(-)|eukprot:CAMPEP_0113682890 /NCGR_PEP_ID=MMETSP0038_2-20120614/12945_1 /TAXON_ID=2898 /ORGANISM="Cryptomonas paramecium" /LENGTH=552 /DNA_ID=CAMNT_0000602071 /DNA_START=70 /DNA_END=1728 /DNA_ORIENTATION=- /assembly_acc=CAM_ASM_000170
MGVLSLLYRPSEFLALLKLKKKIQEWKQRSAMQERDADWEFCYDMLNKVSRSFAIVIEQLGDELRNAICVFYLVLRGLDTVEDDMAIDAETKARLLLSFHESIECEGFTLSYGYKDEKVLLEKFDCVVRAYLTLKPSYRAVIRDITQRMAEGMHKFTVMKVETTQDYDLYCHYVAGLVGIGLSKMFVASGLEDDILTQSETNSNHMGLFLQKTNIIRDFLEDHEDVNEETGVRRVFWPKEIWGLYTDSLQNFTYGKNETQAVACLNHMVADALRHLPYCIEYLSNIKDYQNFLFCAIPQVMAAHTLSLCYANPAVFKGKIRKNLGECRNVQPVKIRKGLSAKLMLETVSMESALDIFEDVIDSISDRVSPSDPTSREMWKSIQAVRDLVIMGRNDAHSCKGVEPRWWEDTIKSSVTAIHDFTPVLISMLIINSLVVDFAMVVGWEWWSKTVVQAGPWHSVVTLWCLFFYSWSLSCLLRGSYAGLTCGALIHLTWSFIELGLGFRQGMMHLDIMAEVVPKCLASGCLLVCSRRAAFRKLTPSHEIKVLRLKAL